MRDQHTQHMALLCMTLKALQFNPDIQPCERTGIVPEIQNEQNTSITSFDVPSCWTTYTCYHGEDTASLQTDYRGVQSANDMLDKTHIMQAK